MKVEELYRAFTLCRGKLTSISLEWMVEVGTGPGRTGQFLRLFAYPSQVASASTLSSRTRCLAGFGLILILESLLKI